MREQNRICFIPRLDIPVNTFWDIGNSDGCAIWFHQQVGMEDRFIGYHEDHGKTLGIYYKELQDRGHIYNKHFLPHDAFHQRLSDNNKSVAQMLCDLGLGEIDKNVIKVDRIPDLSTGILQTRKHFPSAFFDKEGCKLGIERLKNYRKRFIQSEQRWVDEPNKANGCSEAADAFRQWAQAKEAGNVTMANAKIRKLSDRKYTQGGQGGSGGWMGT